jgi:hypothetical protein
VSQSDHEHIHFVYSRPKETQMHGTFSSRTNTRPSRTKLRNDRNFFSWKLIFCSKNIMNLSFFSCSTAYKQGITHAQGASDAFRRIYEGSSHEREQGEQILSQTLAQVSMVT